MAEYLTIDTFSKRTGISKSALRYYESKNLLHPKRDQMNGYRYYSPNDIETVNLISSLRLAGIPIKDIQQYLLESEPNRSLMMEKWLKTLKQKHQLISASLQYLEGKHSGENIFLLEKESENIIWFEEEAEAGKFGAHLKRRKEELKSRNIPIKNGYLKYLSGGEKIKALIGFGVPENTAIKHTDWMEHMPSCVCIAIPFTSEFSQIDTGYHKLMSYALEHRWVPTGPILEWYRNEQLDEVDLILPVIQLNQEGL